LRKNDTCGGGTPHAGELDRLLAALALDPSAAGPLSDLLKEAGMADAAAGVRLAMRDFDCVGWDEGIIMAFGAIVLYTFGSGYRHVHGRAYGSGHEQHLLSARRHGLALHRLFCRAPEALGSLLHSHCRVSGDTLVCRRLSRRRP